MTAGNRSNQNLHNTALPILFLFLLTLCSFSQLGCGNWGLKEVVEEREEEKIDYKLFDFELEYYNFGELSWIFSADTAVVPIEEEYNTAEGVTIKFYKNDELTTKLSADHGEYHVLSGNIIAVGNVVVESVDKDKLLTSKLWWMELIEEFWTDQEVEILRYKDRSRLRGLRMKSDRRLRDIRIDVHLETNIYKPEEDNGTEK